MRAYQGKAKWKRVLVRAPMASPFLHFFSVWGKVEKNTHKEWPRVEIDRVVALGRDERGHIDRRGDEVICGRALARALRPASATLRVHA